jgi:hypothetical protein
MNGVGKVAALTIAGIGFVALLSSSASSEQSPTADQKKENGMCEYASKSISQGAVLCVMVNRTQTCDQGKWTNFIEAGGSICPAPLLDRAQ